MKRKNTSIVEAGSPEKGQLITRKQAIRRSGYMALSAATMLLLLNNSASGQQGPVASPQSTPVKPSNSSTSKPDAIWDD